MSGAALSLSLTRGVIAAFNPCGFAMLPAYLSYFVGTNAAGTVEAPIARLRRAVVVAAATTAGFVVLFSILGFVTTALTTAVTDYIPWASIAIGIGLVALGIVLLSGRELKLSLARFSTRRQGTGLDAMFLYGVSFGTVSTGCSIGTFLSNVTGGSRAEQMAGWIAYALGMGLVLTLVSLAAALAQQAFLLNLRKVLPYVNRISGVLLVVSGLYVAWYGWVEWRTIVPAQRARSSAGKSAVRGASNSSFESLVKSSGGRRFGTRSGQVTANWIGKHMSVALSCASTELSTNSTIE